jgi:hypothetical protein
LTETGSDEDWLLRPVLAGVIRYEALLATDLTLLDVAILNDALDVQGENDRRIWEHAERERRLEARWRR